MAELREGYRAVFYSGEKKISESGIQKTYEEAKRYIERENEIFDVFKYAPWSHAQVEKVFYRH